MCTSLPPNPPFTVNTNHKPERNSQSQSSPAGSWKFRFSLVSYIVMFVSVLLATLLHLEYEYALMHLLIPSALLKLLEIIILFLYD